MRAKKETASEEVETEFSRRLGLAKTRADSITQATWVVLFGAGFLAGQWPPRLAWVVIAVVLALGAVALWVRALKAVAAEMKSQPSVQGLRVVPSESENDTKVA